MNLSGFTVKTCWYLSHALESPPGGVSAHLLQRLLTPVWRLSPTAPADPRHPQDLTANPLALVQALFPPTTRPPLTTPPPKIKIGQKLPGLLYFIIPLLADLTLPQRTF